MKKAELKTAKDNELVAEFANVYALLIVNHNTGRGTKQLAKQFDSICSELIKRGLLAEEDAVKMKG